MPASKYAPPLLVVVLSLGFLGQGPFGLNESNRRHISSCEDTALKPKSATLPTGLFSFVQDDNTRQAAEAYSLFLQALQVNAAMYSLAAPSMYGYPVPAFPNYSAVPVDHYVEPVKPDLSTLAWGGGSLLTDPKLQYLIHPTAMTSQVASKGTLDSLVDLPVIQTSGTLGFSVGSNLVAATVPGPTSIGSVGQTLAGRATEVSKF